MKHTHRFLVLLAPLLLASSALAQTAHSNATADSSKSDLPKQVAAARFAYSQAAQECTPGTTHAPDAGGHNTLAQMPRQYSGPMAGPPMGRPAYPGMWMSQPSPAHLLIGGLIGFGVGVGVGARNNGGVRGSIGIGALFGLIGAGIGAGVPSFPGPRYHRPGWPDEDEEASRSQPKHSKRARSRTAAAAPPDPHPRPPSLRILAGSPRKRLKYGIFNRQGTPGTRFSIS